MNDLPYDVNACSRADETVRTAAWDRNVLSERSMKKRLKPIPKFASEAEERRFWETHDSSEYVEWSGAQRARFPNLKPST